MCYQRFEYTIQIYLIHTIENTMKQYVFNRGIPYRLRAFLGRWTKDMQEDLATELGATLCSTKWQHPAHYEMVKKVLVEIGQVGTRACQDLWGMRREACLQLDAYMTTPQADILEHEKTHLPRLPHACRQSQTSHEKLMAEVRGGNTESELALTTAECRIMVYKLLQCDPNKVWATNHLRTLSNRSGRGTHRQEAVKEAIQLQQHLFHNQWLVREANIEIRETRGIDR
jgi:hypothetical protein